MHADISSENRQFIEKIVADGTYCSQGDALDAAVDLLRSRVELLARIDEGTRQLRSGEYTEYDGESLRQYFDELQARGRARYEANKRRHEANTKNA